MKFMSLKNLVVSAFLPVFASCLMLAGAAEGQSKKGSAAKKADTKKAAASKTVAKKGDAKKAEAKKAEAKKAASKKKEQLAKNAKKEKATRDAKSKAAAKKDTRKETKKDRVAAKEKTKADPKSKKEKAVESKRAAAERRRIEAERRAAILAEQRRREQARREAIARALAFERGLRTETVANIANDKTEGEDLKIRAAAINALGNQAGSVVVMEAQTGRVLTIVNQDWAVRKSIRPCSTIKLVTGAAGLNEGVISKGNGAVKNTPTRRDLDTALAYSDNPYFQRVGSHLGNQKLVEYGKQLGLGEPTGVNLEGETPGRLPYNNNNGRIYSHGDDTEVSTIQLAVMAAAITNGGKRVLPRIPRNAEDKARFQTFYKAKVDLPQQNVRRVIPGMMGAAEYGTARRNMDQTLGVAGKTGSCIDKGSWVGLFTSVAPIEQPKYAVAVITRGQRARGRHAAAVAANIYRVLAPGIVRTDRNLAQTEFKLKPRGYVTPATAVAEEEGTDETDEAIANGELPINGSPVIVVPTVPQQKKLVTKTGTSKPVFPPVIITYDRDGKEVKQPQPKKPE